MIKERVEKAIVAQIKLEEESSRLYLAMASWCESNGFPGAANFLYVHSDEERMHQLKFMHYLNGKGGKAQLMELECPAFEYGSLLEIFEKIMAHEELVTESINNIYEVTLQEKDYTTGQFLQWYIMEQIEEEELFSGILDKMRLAGTERAGLFHMDKELDQMASATAVPAAE